MLARLIGMAGATVMFALAMLHVYWAAGGRWAVAAAVPSREGRPQFSPGPLSTLLVASLLLSAGVVMIGRLGIWLTSMPQWVFITGA